MSRPLLSADDYGARWSYDRTISVRSSPAGYVIHDAVGRTSHVRQSLDLARRVVLQILGGRPQLDWLRSWKRGGHPDVDDSTWWRQSTDGTTAVWVARLPDGWWSIEIDVNCNAEDGKRSCSWRVDGHHPIGVVRAQAQAHAAHLAATEGSP